MAEKPIIPSELVIGAQPWHPREFGSYSDDLLAFQGKKTKEQSLKEQAHSLEFREKELLKKSQELIALQKTLVEREMRIEEYYHQLKDRETALDAQAKVALVQAKENGMETALAKAREMVQPERQALISLTSEWKNTVNKSLTTLRDQTLDFAIEVSKKVLFDRISSAPANVTRVFDGLVEQLKIDMDSIVVYANKRTLSHLRPHLNKLGLQNAAFVEDSEQKDFGFKIKHEDGLIDASLEERWKNTMSALGTDGALFDKSKSTETREEV